MDNTSFLQSKMKFDRETFGGLADMFGQMPGTFWHTFKFQHIAMPECPHTFMSCVLLGCGIGTGPGVIRDHYSPTMGRHRMNPHFSDHAVNGSSLHQTQFDAGNKPFTKQNQVKLNICNNIFLALLIWKDVLLFFYYTYLTNLIHRDRIHQFLTISRTTWCRCSPRTWLHVLARRGSSMPMR